MHQSIQQFVENGIPELKKLQEKFFDDPSKLTEFIMGAQKPIFQVYLDLIGESITAVDEILRNNVYRRKQWTIVKKDQASVLCSVGRIRYQKTMFLNKLSSQEYSLCCMWKLRRCQFDDQQEYLTTLINIPIREKSSFP